MNKNSLLLLLLVIGAFAIRVTNFTFPSFTADEARIAYRGYALAVSGKDELGRAFPLLFNSLTDYQLPVVSYLTAGGELIFGKSEFGARIPFIIIGTLLVLLVAKTAKIFNQNAYFWFTGAFIIAISPTLIFLSKVPNETIVLTFIVTLLFYLLISKKSMVFIVPVMFFAVLTSKQAWFVLLPFVFFTIFFYQKSVDFKKRLIIVSISAIFIFLAFVLFLNVPQAKRSLLENNFSIFSDMTIKNGIDKLRGQGIASGWPQLIDRILFNKMHYATVGFLHWLSSISPYVYFGQFDESGRLSFSQTGALTKILIIPFIGGLIYLIRKGQNKERLLLTFFLILTFPAIFIYPDMNQSLVVLTIPFAAIVAAFGFTQFKPKISSLVILVAFLELGLNLLYLAPEKKITNFLRPDWVKTLAQDVYIESINYRAAVSDDIVNDVTTFIEWYNPINLQTAYLDVPYPYKFRQTALKNIKVIGWDNEPYYCKEEDWGKLFVSTRDKDRIKDPDIKIAKLYQDSLSQNAGYFLERGLCIR